MPSPEFKLQASKQYRILLLLSWFSSIVLTLYLPLGAVSKVILFSLVSWYLGRIAWQFACLRGEYAVLSLQRLSGESWQLRTRTQHHEAVLRSDSTVTSFLSVLRFRIGSRYWPLTCLVFRDSFLKRECYKQLVVVIKMW